MFRTRHLSAVLLLATALAGCSSDPEPAVAPATSAQATATSTAASPSPTSASAPKPPVDGGAYKSPLLIIEALGKGGIDCTGYEAVVNPTGAIARGSCYIAGEEYTIGIYKSATQARQQPDRLAELLKGVSDMDLVLGRNWTVGCPDEPSCRSVAAVLGGEVFHEAA
jgi:outer membrane murein-binding lipoprotein Lpp